MPQLRLVIRKTRHVRDLVRNRRFVVEDRFPGGRTILRGKAQTRPRAFAIAKKASIPQTSPTAGGGAGGYIGDGGTGGNGGGRPILQNN